MGTTPFQTLLKTAATCHQILGDAPHIVMGGIAVCLHGFRRESNDVDILVRYNDWSRICRELENEGFKAINKTEFRSRDGVKASFLYGGENARYVRVPLPDPADTEFRSTFEELPGIAVFGDLLALVKHKIECGMWGRIQGGKHAKRAGKHFRDAVGLIVANNLHS